MTSTASSILELGGNESTKAIRRWGSKTHSPSSNVATPLMDRTNTTRTRSSYSITTTNSTPCGGMTTFLPEMHSTPPMPTFQKPDMGTPTALRRTRNNENATPSRSYLPRRPATPYDNSSVGGLSSRSSFVRPQVPHTTMPLVDRVSETPPLPHSWTRQHDRAICILDASDYSLPAIVQKIRRVFPELSGTLTPAMIDKRLRQLDQIIELDYWAVGLAKTEKQQRRDKAKAGGSENKKLDSHTISRGLDKAGISQSAMDGKPESSRCGDMSRSTKGADETSTTEPSRNLVTRGFLTGFRSQIL